MTALTLMLLAAAAADRPALVSVHAREAEGRVALEVVTKGAPGQVALQREGSEVVLSLDARLPRDLGRIRPVPPLEAIEVRKNLPPVWA